MSTTKAPRTIRVDLGIERSLTNGRAIEIPESFSQLVFDSQDDQKCHVDILQNDASGNYTERYYNNDELNGGLKDGSYSKIEGCKIYNELQPGKILYITIHVDTQHRKGSLVLDGEFSEILPDSGTENIMGITLGGTVQQLIAADPTRRNLTIYNNLAQDVWVKFLSNNLFVGKRIMSGGSIETKNRGEMFVLGAATEAANSSTGVGIHLIPEF